MSIRGAVYNLLKAAEADVYPVVAPQETTATYITFQARMDFERSQDGVEVIDVNLTLNIYDNNHDDCISMANTLSAALDGASGTYDSQTLHVCIWTGEGDGYLPELDKYMITQEYLLRFV